MPKFRFGHIDPAAVEARRARRGPGYEFYQIVPTNIMLVTAVLGIKDFTREAVGAAIPNYWNCVEALAEEKVDVFVLGGTPVSAQLGRARVVRLLKEAEDKTGIRGDAPSGSGDCSDEAPGIEEDSGGRTVDRMNSIRPSSVIWRRAASMWSASPNAANGVKKLLPCRWSKAWSWRWRSVVRRRAWLPMPRQFWFPAAPPRASTLYPRSRRNSANRHLPEPAPRCGAIWFIQELFRR